MLDIYEFDGDIWLCHSVYRQCYDFTAFVSSDIIFQIVFYVSRLESGLLIVAVTV
jgi:hypothetical protein